MTTEKITAHQVKICTKSSAVAHIKRGFTLVELLVVLAIVALLLSIALPRFFTSLDKSKETALAENLRVLRICIDKFHADKGKWPKALDELVESKYLRAIPLDPLTESANSWQVVSPQDLDQTGIADVKSGAPGTDKQGKAYVMY